MPIRKVPNSDQSYYLLIHDENGQERAESDGLLSQKALDEVKNQPVTDVFLMSHGWRGDIPAAISQYDAWTGNLMSVSADIEDMKKRRPGFRPLLIGLHWPSEPWGDEDTGSFALPVGDVVQPLVDDYAKRLGDAPGIREELETIIQAHATVDDPQSLPPEVEAAYKRLEQKLGLGHGGEGAAPGADLPEFDPEDIFQAARQEDDSPSFGAFSIGDLLAPLRVLSFWKMKDRACKFGESGGNQLLQNIHAAAGGRDVNIHLMGHSFGCVVVSAAVAGPAGSQPAVKPHSVVLVQGALSIWAYCSDIPLKKGTAGYFSRLISENRVAGPLVTTQSQFDLAVGTFYPLAAGLKNQVAFGDFPKFGGVGSFGIQGMDGITTGRKMGEVSEEYGFQPGKVYNLESSQFIRSGNPPSGAHSDIAHPQVAHAIWQAAKP
jgi:hypothetical protein